MPEVKQHIFLVSALRRHPLEGGQSGAPPKARSCSSRSCLCLIRVPLSVCFFFGSSQFAALWLWLSPGWQHQEWYSTSVNIYAHNLILLRCNPCLVGVLIPAQSHAEAPHLFLPRDVASTLCMTASQYLVLHPMAILVPSVHFQSMCAICFMSLPAMPNLSQIC